MQPWQQKSSWTHILKRNDNDETIGARIKGSAAIRRPATPRDVNFLKALLQQGIVSTNQMATCTKQNAKLSASVRQLRDVLHLLLNNPGEWSEEAQYQTAYPVVRMMTEIPISFIQISPTNPTVLLTFAHLDAIIVLLAMRFPGLDIPTFAQIYVKSVLELNKIMPRTERSYTCDGCEKNHDISARMAFPLAVVKFHRHARTNNVTSKDLQGSSASPDIPSSCGSDEVPVRFMGIASGSG